MKKTTILILISFVLVHFGCGNQTIESYNNTIVIAHKKLMEINREFYTQSSKFIGNSKSKQTLTQLITQTNAKIAEAKQPVVALIQIKDHGIRKTMLEMFSSSEHAMNQYKNKIEIITNPKMRQETEVLMDSEIGELGELDELIRELQIRYAYYNNAKLR